MKLNEVIKKLKAEKSINTIVWYFNTACVKYGVAKSTSGVIWAVEVSKTRNEVRARAGKPSYLTPTAKLANGLSLALAKIA